MHINSNKQSMYLYKIKYCVYRERERKRERQTKRQRGTEKFLWKN